MKETFPDKKRRFSSNIHYSFRGARVSKQSGITGKSITHIPTDTSHQFYDLTLIIMDAKPDIPADIPAPDDDIIQHRHHRRDHCEDRFLERLSCYARQMPGHDLFQYGSSLQTSVTIHVRSVLPVPRITNSRRVSGFVLQLPNQRPDLLRRQTFGVCFIE